MNAMEKDELRFTFDHIFAGKLYVEWLKQQGEKTEAMTMQKRIDEFYKQFPQRAYQFKEIEDFATRMFESI